MVADVVEPGQRVEAYGLLRIGSNLGWVVGPVLGGAFLIVTSYGNLFLITASGLLIVVGVVRDTFNIIETELKLHGIDEALIKRLKNGKVLRIIRSSRRRKRNTGSHHC